MYALIFIFSVVSVIALGICYGSRQNPEKMAQRVVIIRREGWKGLAFEADVLCPGKYVQGKLYAEDHHTI